MKWQKYLEIFFEVLDGRNGAADFWHFFNVGHYLLQPDFLFLWFALPCHKPTSNWVRITSESSSVWEFQMLCFWNQPQWWTMVRHPPMRRGQNDDSIAFVRRERIIKLPAQRGRTMIFSLTFDSQKLNGLQILYKSFSFFLTIIISIRMVTMCPSSKCEHWGGQKLDYFVQIMAFTSCFYFLQHFLPEFLF